jgi:hypothetical protein
VAVQLKSTDIDEEMTHPQHKFIQEKKPMVGSPARELEPTAAYKLDFIGGEGTGKG